MSSAFQQLSIKGAFNCIYHVCESITLLRKPDYYNAFQNPINGVFDPNLARRVLVISQVAIAIITSVAFITTTYGYALSIPYQIFFTYNVFAGISALKLAQQEDRLKIRILIHATAILALFSPTFLDPKLLAGCGIGLKLALMTQQ